MEKHINTLITVIINTIITTIIATIVTLVLIITVTTIIIVAVIAINVSATMRKRTANNITFNTRYEAARMQVLSALPSCMRAASTSRE